VTTHEDDMNVYLTLYCRRLRPDVQIISRATLDRNISTLHRAGADAVLSYASLGATAIWNASGKHRTVVLAEGLEVFRLPMPRSMAGHSLMQCAVSRETGCYVVATARNGDMETTRTRRSHCRAMQISWSSATRIPNNASSSGSGAPTTTTAHGTTPRSPHRRRSTRRCVRAATLWTAGRHPRSVGTRLPITMGSEDALQDYLARRDLDVSGEPGGGEPGARPRFVIQRHDASRLHFDFRLEVDGVLKSWAVPKGPSTDPRDKRLAVPTEDHPLDYIDFEGYIPQDHYGGGTVIVWDTGTYQNITEDDGEIVDMATALDAGHVKVWLDGHKLTGGYALTRTSLGGDDDQWLLVKVDDAEADRRRNAAETQLESVLSGRTNEDLEPA